ncbi:hypothetical protein [Wenyingzhuangia sp. IMCC45574]
MKFKVTLLFVFFIVIKCFSQTDVVQLQGLLKSDSLKVDAVTVTNKTFKMVTTSNQLGAFIIPVRKGDSIVINAVHIENNSFFISDTIFKVKEITVELKPRINELKEVVLNSLLSDAALDFSAALNTPYVPDDIAMRRNEVRQLADTNPIKVGGGSGIDLLEVFYYVTKLFKKKNKNQISKKKSDQLWMSFKVDLMEEKKLSFFTNDLGIPELLIDDFFEYCREHQKRGEITKLYKNHQEFEVLDFLIKQSESFKRLHKIQKRP